MYFDTHAHLDVFGDGGLLPALQRAAEAGVGRLLAIGGTPDGNRFAAQAAAANPGRVWCACGYEREQAALNPPMADLEVVLDASPVSAIGECGLDYHYSAGTAAAQQRLFASMLNLAAARGLPIVVHSREADDDTLNLLAGYRSARKARSGIPGVLHCFTGSAAFAEQVLDLGFMISFSGILTFRNAGAVRAVAAFMPGDRLLIETDSPALAPEPHRGRPNEPARLRLVAEALARLRGVPWEAAAELTARNAERLFAAPPEA